MKIEHLGLRHRLTIDDISVSMTDEQLVSLAPTRSDGKGLGEIYDDLVIREYILPEAAYDTLEMEMLRQEYIEGAH